ncbi:hypothetical protein ACGFNU_16440 [Spirillospora sp. NPDC048911]|uniref:hypothetical protein n=1 Tax=Spirillospora sp. NPDC048911 TaxID=3364527 RepID=UPI0037111D0D
MTETRRTRAAALTAFGLAGALTAGACTGGGNSSKAAAPVTSPKAPACIKEENGGKCLPLAPDGKRVDLIKPVFSRPTSITNRLHPTSGLDQVLYGGQVDGEPFRTEFTRLPGSKTYTWDGQRIETVVVQYLAFSGGRVTEVATDAFAQADDGAVWYFGEDVTDFEDGLPVSHEGTWHAGTHGPPAMIMPAAPRVGVVYRSENIPGFVFEEVTVKAVGGRVAGPSGPVTGTMTGTELHMDGQREDKIFAPGYGEYSTGSPKGDLEQATLALPTDARPGPVPARLAALSKAVHEVYEAVGKRDWSRASTAAGSLRTAWDPYRADGLPSLLEKQMTRDIASLGTAVGSRSSAEARGAALRVAQNDLDLHARHEPVAKVDFARLGLWTRQLVIDAAARDTGSAAGDITTFELTRDRVRHTIDPATAAKLDAALRNLRGAINRKDLAAVTRSAPTLVTMVADLHQS